MAGSEPIFQIRNKDSRFTDASTRSVLNGIPQIIVPTTVELGGATSETTTGNRQRTQSLNRIVEFEGDTYWFHRNVIRTHVPGSGWTNSPTTLGSRGLITSMNDTEFEGAVVGLYPFLTEAGEQKLAAVYSDSAFNARMGIAVKNSKYTSDGLWSAETTMTIVGGLTSTGPGNGGFGYPVLDGNKLYLQWYGLGNVSLYRSYVEIDLENKSATLFGKTPLVDLPGNIGSTSGNNVLDVPPSVFCSYSGVVWHLYRCGGAGASLGSSRPYNQRQAIVVERVRQILPQLDLVVISGMTPDGNPGAPGGTVDYFEGRSDMFVVPASGRMYALTFINGSGLSDAHGWACWRFRYDNATDKLINEGDIGWKVLPPPLRLSTSSTISITSKVKSYSLVDVSGQLTTIIEYMNDGDQGSLVNTYEWIDEDTEMRLLNTGGDASWSRPLIKLGGGESVWSPRQPYNFTFRVDASGAAPGKVKLRTRVLGSSEAVKVRYYFTSSKGPMEELANISAPTSGSIAANELTGITANSGEFTVDWDIQAQGFSLNDTFNIHPVAEDN